MSPLSSSLILSPFVLHYHQLPHTHNHYNTGATTCGWLASVRSDSHQHGDHLYVLYIDPEWCYPHPLWYIVLDLAKEALEYLLSLTESFTTITDH
jgi:hypothetical protein